MVSMLTTCPFPSIRKLVNRNCSMARASSKQTLMNHHLSNPPLPKMERKIHLQVPRAKLEKNKTFLFSVSLWRLPDFILRKMIDPYLSTICHFELHSIKSTFFKGFCFHWGMWFCCVSQALYIEQGEKESWSFLLLEVRNMYFAFLLTEFKHLNRFSSDFSQIIHPLQATGDVSLWEKHKALENMDWEKWTFSIQLWCHC